MIIRYTTPYHNFILPFLSSEVQKITVTYTQNGEKLITKELKDIEICDVQSLLENASVDDEKYIKSITVKTDDISESSLLIVHLTQEETSKFTFYKAAEKNIALVQIHVLNIEGDAFVSRPIKIRVYGNIKDEVI